MIHSNFLLQGDEIGMTLLIPAYPMADAFTRIERVAANGYTDIDFYACNRGDNPFHQSHHATDAAVDDAVLISCCVLALKLGLGITLWGFADDSNWTVDEALAKQSEFLPRIAPYIDRYIPALEGNETFGFDGVETLVNSAAAHVPESVPIYLHWTHGEVGGASWDAVRGIYYQYAPSSRTPAAVESETRAVIGKWHDARRMFIAGEFMSTLSPDDARACGAAALRGGADGSACGGW